jgi:hypothetical protein
MLFPLAMVKDRKSPVRIHYADGIAIAVGANARLQTLIDTITDRSAMNPCACKPSTLQPFFWLGYG